MTNRKAKAAAASKKRRARPSPATTATPRAAAKAAASVAEAGTTSTAIVHPIVQVERDGTATVTTYADGQTSSIDHGNEDAAKEYVASVKGAL